MEYLALYRKFRPDTFENVIGQNHITTSLINQINSNNISHAYLFTGSRGTGKTSIARIFARAINCVNPQNGSPCGKCEVCEKLSNANNLDIIEIDAASNNRVEEIRDLRDKVKYPPVVGKYKVYIIDEVHMLTDSAFNALLKTLEEPPSYVVFILGTTEVQKLPATILSRCMRFDFKLVSNNDLENHLKKLFDQSQVKYDDLAVQLIARLGQGSVRDTLSIADMCIAFSNKNVTYDKVVESVGVTPRAMVENICLAVINKDINGILENIHTASLQGKNMAQLNKDLCQYFRDLAVVKTTNDYKKILCLADQDIDKLLQIANEINIEKILYILKNLSSLEQEFRLTENTKNLLEIVLLTLTSEMPELFQLKERVDKLEKMLTTKNQPMKIQSNTVTKVIEPNYVVDENKQEFFGKLLVALRENNMFRHYVLLENMSYDLKNNIFTLFASSESEYQSFTQSLQNQILDVILTINGNISLKVEYNKVEKVNVLEILKRDFSDILIIE